MGPHMRKLLLAPLFLLTAPALAQNAPSAPDIVVTGMGLAAPLGDAAYDVVTIDRTRLTGSASGRLEDILRDAAGFQQFRRSDSRSAQPTSQGATLRGLGGNASSRALILLDGVPQVDPFGGWVNWPAFDPARLGMVRITRGGGSGVNGPGAIAGTIELSSAGPAQLAPVWGSVAYGSRDSFDADAGVSGALGGGFGSISAGYSRGDGFIPIVREDRGPIDTNSPYEQANVAARAVVPIGAETELQANGLVIVDHRTRGVAFTDNQNIGADASLRLVGRGRWGWEAVTWLQVREFESGFSSVNAARTTSTATLDQYNVPATGVGGRFEIRPPIAEHIELRLGADVRQTTGQTKELYTYVAGLPTRRREAGGQTRTLGAFADASLEVSDVLTLTGGGRIDRWWIDDGFLRETTLATQAPLTNTAFNDRQGWEPTGRAGFALKPTGAITLRGAGYLGWRLPTLNELYRPYRVGTDAVGANAGLSPERLKGVDAGIEFRPLTNVRFGGTLFWNKLDNAITNVTLGTGPGTFPIVGFVAAGGSYRQRQNLGAIRSRGAELDAAVDVAAWRLSASYSYTDARVHADGAALALDGLRPAQTPKHQASATIGYGRSQNAQGSLTVRYVADQFEDDQNVRVLSDAVTLDAAFVVPVAAGFSIEVRGENVTNTRVEAGISGADIVERATPRTLWLGLRYAGR
jgi:vitamin B12 transporter